MFAGAVISSGATYAPQNDLAGLIGIPIRNFYGSEDEDGLESATVNTMARYVRYTYVFMHDLTGTQYEI